MHALHWQTLPNQTSLLALQESDPERFPFLLESRTQSDAGGRYDILFADPGESLELFHHGLTVSGERIHATEFLASLDGQWMQKRTPSHPDYHFPFQGGWFLYLSYELAAEIEPRLSLTASRDGWPVALAVYCPRAVIRDHATETVYAVGTGEEPDRLDDFVRHINGHPIQCTTSAQAVPVRHLREDDPEPFLDGVSRIKSYIRAGDVLQVNYSRGWEAELCQDYTPRDLYRALRRVNPAPFACSAYWGKNALLSSSPERLLCGKSGQLETRPIAGTRPRAKSTSGHDAALSGELLTDPKERSEHIMLVDLERNDLGRVCQPGSIQVNELMALETYAHVHHIVSNISGRKLPHATPGETVAAMFPGGTITGAPKIRCMEIISELEQMGRGAYTGSVGYLSLDGTMDFNILIRTLVLRENQVQFRAGAGIVADSEPKSELAETRHKAHGMLRAMQGQA